MSTLKSNIRMQKERNRKLQESGEEQKVYNLIKDYNENTEPPTGEKYCKCQKCGKVFEQNLSEDRNAYSSYKTCPTCRNIKSAEQMEKIKKKQREISRAELPYTPFPAQQEIHDAFETHRFVVIDAGNRFGKDRCSIMCFIKYFVECLNENRQIDNPDMVPPVFGWILAPTERLAQQNWRELCKYFPREWVVAKSNSNYQMQTVGGGLIEVRSGYDPESLVGVGIDCALLTEAARFNDLDMAWANIEARLSSPGRGREKDRKGAKYGLGKAIINSSPLGKNFFYEMWKWGQEDSDTYDSSWKSFKFAWTENPANKEYAQEIIRSKYGPITREESLRMRLGDRLYRQNYLGDFLAGDAAVFVDFDKKCVVNPYAEELTMEKDQIDKYIKEWSDVIPMHEYRGGYDPATGSSQDNPWFVIRDVDTNRIVVNMNLYGKTYEQQIQVIAMQCQKYNYATLYWLRTGHTALQGLIDANGIPNQPLDEQFGHKAEYVQKLSIAVQNEDVHVLMDGTMEAKTLINQMLDYSQLPSGNVIPKYGNKTEQHDDSVSALYAVYNDYQAFEIPVQYCPLIGEV